MFIEEKPEFEKCFVDADSIIYRVAASTDSMASARSKFDKFLSNIMELTDSVEGFVAVRAKDKESNFRYEVADDYKANRSNSKQDPKVIERVDMLYEYAWDEGCIPSEGCEADDVVSIWAQEAKVGGASHVIAHIDKDIDMIEGWHYNFNRNDLYEVTPEKAYFNLCSQLLTGDPSDNIKGLHMVGPQKAKKLLKDKSVEEMFEKIVKEWWKRYPDTWEEELNKCFNLIYIRRRWEDLVKLDYVEFFDVKVPDRW